MSDAFKCDKCKGRFDGHPSAQLGFDNSMAAYTNPAVEEGRADLCNGCWIETIGELGLTVANNE